MVEATYDDGTPLTGGEVDVAIHHELLEDPTVERTLQTNDEGKAYLTLDGELGMDAFLPGEHTVDVATEGPSLADAPVQDTETLAMDTTFRVTPT
jgi:hypothetical protein